ncbi:MAG TPA: ferrochelatase [Rhizomicrobium sp.]|nr:ferrochelatase [Rhizomicrobium sp.]
MKLAVVLFNLGGPDSPEAVEPFLRNLFSDPAIISLPGLLRLPLARFVAARRAPIAREIYAKIGGRSPILEETEAQARALENSLSHRDLEAKTFIAMRCWKPFSDEAAGAVAAWKPDRTVLLPLYPQYSTTTTASSVEDWHRAAARAGLTAPEARVCCYPEEPGFVAAEAALIREALAKRRPGIDYRLLLSAHGLPKRVIERGDPYQSQVESSAAAIVAAAGAENLDWRVCYQSRVGPLEWIGPATDAEIRAASEEAMGLIVAPIAFVSEHSETLVELDIEYAKLARESGARDYIRVPTVGTRTEFIEGLARLVLRALDDKHAAVDRHCPAGVRCCGYSEGI